MSVLETIAGNTSISFRMSRSERDQWLTDSLHIQHGNLRLKAHLVDLSAGMSLTIAAQLKRNHGYQHITTLLML